jgi:hypothetical protein
MRLKIRLVGLLFALLASMAQAALAQQSGNPLSGTWTGDWGPSPTEVGWKSPYGYGQSWSRRNPD